MKREASTRQLSPLTAPRNVRLSLVLIALSLLLSLPAGAVAADLLVDTGPAGTTGGSALFSKGNTLCTPQPTCAGYFQHLAGRFTLASGATLDAVEGWMYVYWAGSVEVKIRTDNNGLPGASIYSQTYAQAAQPVGWARFPNFGAVLAAGTYWLTFEPVANTGLDAVMPKGAPMPLQEYAFFNDGNNRWLNYTIVGPQPGLGMRIYGTSAPVAAFGTVARAVRKGEFGDFFDATRGGVGEVKTRIFAGNPYGVEAAWGELKENGLAVGSWSSSYIGTARGIAFRTFRNSTNETKTFKVKAILNGRFERAPWDLPTGPLSAAAAVRVLDSQVFSDRLNASGVSAGQFLLGTYDLTTAGDPNARFAETLGLFSGGILGFGQNLAFNGPFDQPISTSVETNFITVGPQQSFVVMFDLATYSLYRGAFGCHEAICQPVGHGSVYFHDSLSPAPDFFVGLDGNPVTGIEAQGPSAAPTPSAATLTLTPATASSLVDTTHTVTALATTAQGAPVPEAVVRFEVISGPHAGLVDGGLTDANGQATFTYTGTRGAGTDDIRAQIGELESNVVQKTWTPKPKPTPDCQSCGEVKGKGSLTQTRGEFFFNVDFDKWDKSPEGVIRFKDKNPTKVDFKSSRITCLIIEGNQKQNRKAILRGEGVVKVKGQKQMKVNFEVEVTDFVSGTFKIKLIGGYNYQASGPAVSHGFIEIERSCQKEKPRHRDCDQKWWDRENKHKDDWRRDRAP